LRARTDNEMLKEARELNLPASFLLTCHESAA
jgi:hypothetical protein